MKKKIYLKNFILKYVYYFPFVTKQMIIAKVLDEDKYSKKYLNEHINKLIKKRYLKYVKMSDIYIGLVAIVPREAIEIAPIYKTDKKINRRIILK
jgi:hypothetical protein